MTDQRWARLETLTRCRPNALRPDARGVIFDRGAGAVVSHPMAADAGDSDRQSTRWCRPGRHRSALSTASFVEHGPQPVGLGCCLGASLGANFVAEV